MKPVVSVGVDVLWKRGVDITDGVNGQTAGKPIGLLLALTDPGNIGSALPDPGGGFGYITLVDGTTYMVDPEDRLIIGP